MRHCYVGDRKLGWRVEEDIRAIRFALQMDTPVFLDLGSGTGYLSRAFLKYGFEVFSVDISHKMLKVSKEKLAGNRFFAVNAEIDEFLDMATPGRFHVLGFSSTLHHLQDYSKTLIKCCILLPPGGFLYIINEPPMQKHSSVFGNFIDTADELLDGFMFKLMRDRGDLPGAFMRRIMIFFKKILNRNPSSEKFLGMFNRAKLKSWADRTQHRYQKNPEQEFIDDTVAEIHADTGLDLELIKKLIDNQSCELVEYSFYSTKRYFIFRCLETLFPGSRHCRMIVRKQVLTANEGSDS
jgi:SAM-dependent methyltransferase